MQANVSLKPYNTFGIDVSAHRLGIFHNPQELLQHLEETAALALPHMVLGGGSNVLFTAHYPGVVLLNRVTGVEVVDDNGTDVWVRAGAGENWHLFVQHCIDQNLGGLENLSLIPGNVGAGPMQNIGAYGVELKETFHSLEALEKASGQVITFTAPECAFGYRESVFKRALKDKYVILSVTFRLTRKPQFNTTYGAIEQELQRMGITTPSLRAVSDAVMNIRRSKLPDPAKIGNAGSFFKNPVVSEAQVQELLQTYPAMPYYPAGNGQAKLAAGWLIEQAGWKGKNLGNYGVHALQALVLVNYGGATGTQIYDLSEAILQEVHQRFGVTLEREVNIV